MTSAIRDQLVIVISIKHTFKKSSYLRCSELSDYVESASNRNASSCVFMGWYGVEAQLGAPRQVRQTMYGRHRDVTRADEDSISKRGSNFKHIKQKRTFFAALLGGSKDPTSKIVQ